MEVAQLGEPMESPAPYSVKEALRAVAVRGRERASARRALGCMMGDGLVVAICGFEQDGLESVF